MQEIHPHVKARIAGLIYLMVFLSAPSGAAGATPVRMVINLACDLGVAILLYDLLRPVSKTVSLLAALFRLIFVLVMAVNSLNYFGVTEWVQHNHSAAAFDAAYGMALVPFGMSCILIGCLIFKSTFLPRVLGVLMVSAGAAYLIFLWPRLGGRLFIPWIVVPAVVGEASLTLWLLIMGVNNVRWKQQDDVARETLPLGIFQERRRDIR
ncbi:DUF4386 domain-containing protein [Granulicella arctica]|uniref:DUF4386 domain-containing protein n=1 Tax=Granulicella arctica TaxID=940613 RepID=UPI0021E00533|nr:DUF4386 domain-containing protein [Granulicella arctica]